eukprot:PhM_4_TR18715/c1_g2_i1/m.62351
MGYSKSRERVEASECSHSVLGRLEAELACDDNDYDYVEPDPVVPTVCVPRSIRPPAIQPPPGPAQIPYRTETAATARKSLKESLNQTSKRIWDGLDPENAVTIPAEILLVCERWPEYPARRVYSELRDFLLDIPAKEGLAKKIGAELKTQVDKGLLATLVEQVFQDSVHSRDLFAQTCRRVDKLVQELVRKKVVATQGGEAGKQFMAHVHTYPSNVPASVKAYHVAISGFRMPALSSVQGKTGNAETDE